jgi:hypothetical protein
LLQERQLLLAAKPPELMAALDRHPIEWRTFVQRSTEGDQMSEHNRFIDELADWIDFVSQPC